MPKVMFRRRLIGLILAFLLPILALSLGFSYWMASQALRGEIRDRLFGAAVYAASLIDGDQHATLLKTEDEGSRAYRETQRILTQLQWSTPGVVYALTAVPLDQKRWRYVVDDMEMSSPFRLHNETGILDQDAQRYVIGSEDATFEVAAFPNFEQALKEPVVDQHPYSDRYGTWLAAYAPFFHSDGRPAGVVEVGMSLERLREEERTLGVIACSILGIAIALTVLLAFIIAGWVTRPIRQLMLGTQQIAAGDLRTPVRCTSADEFGILADSFNEMCAQLDAAQKELIEKERYQQEMELASRIQHSMLPQVPPPLPTLDIAFHFQPLDEVGGDYYDLLPLSDGKLGIAIGDVAGHGLGAALLMSMAKSSLHTQASRGAEVLEVMTSINDMVYSALKERRFMTFFYSVLDTGTLSLTYANAGHHYPYHLDRRMRQLTSLLPSVYPLGVRKDVDYPVRQKTLSPGDILIFYSDGMVESKNSAGEEFGFERLEAAIWRHQERSAASMRDHILAELASFCGSQRAEDDQTIVIIKLKAA